MLCSEATLGDCEEFTKVLLADQTWDHGLDIQSLEVSSPGVHDVLEQDQAFRAFRSFPVVVTFQEEHPKYGLTLEGNLVDRDETFVRIRQGGRVLELERTAVREVRLVPAEDGDNL
jgi:ribosome maturation factor RimP